MQIDIGQQRGNPRSLRRTYFCLRPSLLLHHSGFQPFPNQPQDARIGHAMLDELHHPFVVECIEKPTNICVQHIVHLPSPQRHRQRIQRLMLAASWPETIGEAQKVLLVNLVEDSCHSLLDEFVLQCRNSQRSLPTVSLRDIHSPGWLCPIRSTMDSTVQIKQPIFQSSLILLPCHAVHSRCSLPLHSGEAFPEQIDCHMVKQRGEL